MSSYADTKLEYNVYKNVDLGTGVNLVQSGSTDVFGWYAYNTGSDPVFIRLYDEGVANNDGLESSCKFSFTIPNDGGSNINWQGGVRFITGMSVNCSINVTGLTAPTGESVNLTLLYK